ncbi:MAG: PilZ domain-containing protein [Aquisalimonadaceae bacterium]
MAANKDYINPPSDGDRSDAVPGDARGKSADGTDVESDARGKGLFVELPRGEEDLLQWLVTSENVELLAGEGEWALKFQLQSSPREHESKPPRLRLGFPNVVDRSGPSRGLRVTPQDADHVVVSDVRGRLRDVRVLDLSSTGLRLWHSGYAIVRLGSRISGLRLALPGQPVIAFSGRIARVADAEPGKGGQYVAIALDDNDVSPGDRLAIRQYILDRHLDN